MKKFSIRCFIGVCLIAATTFAQPAPSPISAEAEKTKQENEKKALAWLDEIITGATALKLPENRAYVQMIAADLLWPKDETRARALFQEAAAALTQMISGIESDDPNYYNRMQAPSQLRQQMLQTIARRDAQLALDILRATRPPTAPEQDRNSYNPEANLEAQLAVQAAQSDPKRALQMAEESLETGYAHGVLETISQLQTKDPEAAKTLASKLVAKLKSEDLTKNPQASGFVGSVLFMMNNQATPRGAEGASKTSLFSEQEKKEFIEMVVATTLKGYETSAEGGAFQLGHVLQQTMPLVEKYAPTQLPALRRKFPAPPVPVPVQNRAYEELQQLQQKGSVEQLLAFAKTTSSDLSSQAYQQAAAKVAEQGDAERAREIINTYVPSNQRRNMLDNIGRNLVWRALDEGKLDQARRQLARLQSKESKVILLQQMAEMIAIHKKDTQTAMELLDEARTLTGNRVETSNQFNSQMRLIRSYAQLEPTRAIEMFEPLVTQLNALIAASEVLDGFEQRNGYQNGEMRLQGGGGMMTNLLQQFAETLAVVASSEFDRSQTIIDRFERNETRLWARLSVVQKILRSEPVGGELGRIRRERTLVAPPLPPVFRRNED